ncbi:glycosyltransferase 52 family protein [Vibrio metschnikovii]|uniref:glycosyltransferase 52 family protein n=1 Tax=Vibrio metschnikovii TaxID=28172 RepID=UPI002A59362A|nr:glycosyltransferase 52 family protein [Vibrio metschnikovii]EKO3743065.1 glycosyltransferase 52 family protein [Vibrio metschnikovii]
MNLFLVTSPFQYICALEAKKHYRTRNNILFLVHQESEKGKQIEGKVVSYNDWDFVINTTTTNRSKQVPMAINKIKSIIGRNKIEHFFHAEYTAWRTKLILKNLPIHKEVYFDDGTQTINQYEEVIRNKIEFYRPRVIQDLIVRLHKCKVTHRMPQSENLEIFTIFDIPNPLHCIKKNTLSELKKRYNVYSLYNPTAPFGFIGQGSIGNKRKKTINSYLKEVMYFKEKTQGDIIYFPHRTESEEVKNNIMNIDGLIYHQSELPLEIELIDKKIELSGLVGILSTVQYTSLLLYPDMPIYNLFNPNQSEDYQLTEFNVLREKRILDLFERNGIKNIIINY